MAKWQRTLDIHDSWQKAKHGTVTIQALAGEIAAKMRALKPIGDEQIDYERDEIADEFEALAEDEKADTEDFDYVMENLYDWADRKLDDKWNGRAVCWISTAFPIKKSA